MQGPNGFHPKQFSEGQKAWVVAVDMGYGHQRAAYPLKFLASGGKILNANNYAGMPVEDRNLWKRSRLFYEFISRFKSVPLVGKAAFDLFDRFQEIPHFYPKRDLTRPTWQLRSLYYLMHKHQWGKHLIDKLAKDPLPIVTTFFTIAFMAEEYNYPGEIYTLATDTDISRVWAAYNPAASRIKYFAPNYRVFQRLKEYGICDGKVFITGFPLPFENIGTHEEVLKEDLAQRIVNLDPRRHFLSRYQAMVNQYLCPKECPNKRNRPPTIVFAVGGAGAQRDIAMTIAGSLKPFLLKNKVALVLVAGIHNDVSRYFRTKLREMGLGEQIGKNIEIIFAANKNEYFRKFNKALRTADILWTKPSELSFYTGLGIPIIMTPPIGAQEKFNRRWIFAIGAGFDQEDPRYAHQWLFDWMDSGWLSEACMQGYLEAPREGTYNIAKIISHKMSETKEIATMVQY